MQRLHGGRDSSAVASSLVALATCLMNQHRYSEGGPYLQQAVAMHERLAGGKDSYDVAEAVTRLADLYCRQSRFKKAHPLIERALGMCERLHIEESMRMGHWLMTCATLLHSASHRQHPHQAARPLLNHRPRTD